MVVLGVIAFLESLSSDELSPADAMSDAIFIPPAVVAGVFLGYSVFDAWWGVWVGAMVVGLLAVIPATIAQSLFERRGY